MTWQHQAGSHCAEQLQGTLQRNPSVRRMNAQKAGHRYLLQLASYGLLHQGVFWNHSAKGLVNAVETTCQGNSSIHQMVQAIDKAACHSVHCCPHRMLSCLGWMLIAAGRACRRQCQPGHLCCTNQRDTVSTSACQHCCHNLRNAGRATLLPHA